MKWFVSLFFAGCVVAGVLSGCGGGRKNNAPDNLRTTGLVVVVSDSPDVGGVDTIALGGLVQGDVVTGEFMLRNESSGPIVVLNVESSCGCTTVDYPKQPVMPGQVVSFPFRVDTEGFIGLQRKLITIRTTPNYRTFRVVLTADIAGKSD